MKNAGIFAATLSIILLLSAPAAMAETPGTQPPDDGPGQELFGSGSFYVDCDRGRTIERALRRARLFDRAEITFSGSCEEVLRIDRDHLTLQGADGSAEVVGAVDVVGASNVTLQGFLIRGGPDSPVGSGFGGINVTGGAGVTIDGMQVQDIVARGIRVIGSTATIRDTTVLRAALGNFVFRSASLGFGGTLVGNESPFGMSLVASTASARNADFVFDQNFFGLIIQLDSGFEHVEGTITTNDNQFVGLFLAGQGILAFGSQVETRRNGTAGVMVDELSSLTPLIGAPGTGPALTVEDNPALGIAVTRGSTIQLFSPTVVRNNDVGLMVEDSTLILGGSTIRENLSTDVTLGFVTKATFSSGNDLGDVVCDDTVHVRGDGGCTTVESASASATWLLDRLRRLTIHR